MKAYLQWVKSKMELRKKQEHHDRARGTLHDTSIAWNKVLEMILHHLFDKGASPASEHAIFAL